MVVYTSMWHAFEGKARAYDMRNGFFVTSAGPRFVVAGHGERGVHHLGQKEVGAGRMAGRHTQVCRAPGHILCSFVALGVG